MNQSDLIRNKFNNLFIDVMQKQLNGLKSDNGSNNFEILCN